MNIQVSNIFIANTRAKSADVNKNFSDLVGILASHHHDPNIYTNAVPITNSGIAQNAQILDTQLKLPITRSGLINPSALIPVTYDKGGTGLAGYANEDLIVAVAGGAFRRLAIGAAGQAVGVLGNNTIGYITLPTSKFGGSGADGSLSISSGTTNIDLGGVRVYVKNYSSISITGTGALTFSNPHANGTIIILKCSGNVTLTSSATPMIDASGMGASGGAAQTQLGAGIKNGVIGNSGFGSIWSTNGGVYSLAGSAGAGGSASSTLKTYEEIVEVLKYIDIFVGAGGGSGGVTAGNGTVTSGVGGAGGGAFLIECAGSFNFTTGSISVAGKNGGTATQSGSTGYTADAGGGGAGGYLRIIYNTLTANTGTVVITGGTGGNGICNAGSNGGAGGGASGKTAGSNGTTGANNTKTGGDGATGFYTIQLNTFFA